MKFKLSKIKPQDMGFYEKLFNYFEKPGKEVFCFLAFDLEEYVFSNKIKSHLNLDNEQITAILNQSIDPVYEGYVESVGKFGIGERRRFPRVDLNLNQETKPFVTTKLIDFTAIGLDFVLFLLFPSDLILPEKINENIIELIYEPSYSVGLLNKETITLSNSTKLKLEDVKVKAEAGYKGKKILFFQNPNSTYFNEFIKDFSEVLKSRDEQIHYRELLTESIFSGFWDWNITTNYEYLSPQFKAMFGYNVDEMENTPESWQKIAYKEDLPSLFNEFNKHIESKGVKPFSSITRFYHKEGYTKYVLCSGRVVDWDEDWNPKRAIGTHVDLTEQFETRKKLDQKTEEADNIFSFSNSLFFLIDKEGEIVWNSPNIKEKLKTSEDDLTGQSVLTLLNRKPGTINSFLEDKIEIKTSQNERWYEVFATEIRQHLENENVDSAKYFFQLQDITERKKAEDIYKKNLEKEEKIIEQQKVFLSASSHILRTPLSVINTNIEIINEKVKALELSKKFTNIEVIQNQVKKINGLISDMTEYTNVKEREKSKVNAEELIDLIVEEARDHKIDFSVEKKTSLKNYYTKSNKVNLTNLLNSYFTLINAGGEQSYSYEIYKSGNEIYVVYTGGIIEGFHNIVKNHFNGDSTFDIDHMSSKIIELQFKFEFFIELVNIELLKFKFKEADDNSISYTIAFNLYEN
ncbi:PAS domain-containing protein [Salibacter halophilus]|uniref:histidine kinase n=1 Tax=Salibacter halophilus TaxID=1803916 RepID=A0A6N6M3B9_9FLAO|nr:PAS domain-containing protein [Salibacter halophilus]KAB1063635.1 PAS domain-containing protein [Salibacter halophilus]